MNELSIPQLVYIALAGGLLGTGVMTLFMLVVDKSGLANADMMRAVGSLLTKRYDNALLPGVLIHFTSGTVIAVVYALLVQAFDPTAFNAALAFSTALSVVHGGVVGLLLVVAVAERHPLEQFRQAGFIVAAVHWLAHVLYGFVVGLVVASALF
jgi:hypothetical protein